tara:strand:+ start:181 stop:447 length:267 start_codon:yes stop_codon:yes gene_type:complete
MEQKVHERINQLNSKLSEPEIWLTINEVMSLVAMTKSTIYRYIKDGKFPDKIKLNPDDPNSGSRWEWKEIEAFMKARSSHRSRNGDQA